MTAKEILSVRIVDSPLGRLQLIASGAGLLRIAFPGHHDPALTGAQAAAATPLLEQAENQLEDYFAGRLRSFRLRLAATGTPFQMAVWKTLREIPYGETWSYRDVAERLGNTSAVRAVGAANSRNPLPIVVPCHRVIGADGSLTGFAGGLENKRLLLRLEGALPA